MDPEAGEILHNIAGAWREAVEHYAQPTGLAHAVPDPNHPQVPWSWMDVCFGLGYGTWALLARLAACEGSGPPAQVLAFETNTDLSKHWQAIVESLRSHFPAERQPSLAIHPHKDRFEIEVNCGERCLAEIQVHMVDFRGPLPACQVPVDFVLHDAFTPQLVPQLWTVETLAEYHRLLLLKAGRLMTYSTSAAVLGALLLNGFHVYRTPALGLKRGGSLACTQPLPEPLPPGIQHLPADDLAILATRSGFPYKDATWQADAHTVLSQRNAAQRASSLPGRIDLSRQDG